MKYFLAIIGGGPAGYTAAEIASKAGKDVVIFEQTALGGTCLNVGCIPTKTLLYSAKQYYNATHADKYGVKAEAGRRHSAHIHSKNVDNLTRFAVENNVVAPKGYTLIVVAGMNYGAPVEAKGYNVLYLTQKWMHDRMLETLKEVLEDAKSL